MARTRKTASLQSSSPLREKQVGFFNVPDSTAGNLIIETLGAGEGIADLPARKKQINHNSNYEVLEDGKRRQVKLSNTKAEVTIELADIDKLTGSNKPAKKLFVLNSIKINEQALFNGQLSHDYVSFPLQELIDSGFYSTPQSARKGFKAGMDALTSIKVQGTERKTKKKTVTAESMRVLFTGYDIKNGQCVVYLNPHFNWNFIAQYFTILPRYYFKLPNRASDLLYYIFFLARQHTRDIKERGYFAISFRAIQHRLQLPSEVGNTRPQQTIKQPIEEAIEELEKEHSSLYGNTEFSLLPVYDDLASIKDYLDNGYLKICLTGEFAESFIAISENTAKQIDTAQKRQARITEKAVAIKTAKALEEAERSGKQ